MDINNAYMCEKVKGQRLKQKKDVHALREGRSTGKECLELWIKGGRL